MLQRIQGLPTSGARAILPFSIDGRLLLAVPQLAEDTPGEPPAMNGGNSDVAMPIFVWREGRFEPWRTLPVSGGEDVEHFRIDGRDFLATASLRKGRGPYQVETTSTLWEWRDGDFVRAQEFPTFAAKQWRHFTIGERHFLALAQGVVHHGLAPSRPYPSTIFEWDGARFRPFQELHSAWGYNWCHFRIDDGDYLAYADHAVPSSVLRWDGARFVPFQTLDGASGRAFCWFDGHLAFANLLGNSLLYRWDGARLIACQTISGPGAREFTGFVHDGRFYLAQASFITGTQQAPVTALDSVLYRFDEQTLVRAATFGTLGATDVATFAADGALYLAVAESLSAEVRFRTDSHIYGIG